MTHGGTAAPPPYADGLRRAAPESRGIDPAGIDAFVDEAHRLGVELNSLMLYRHGAVIAEHWWSPYRDDRRHMFHSATKSFLSAAVGLAIADGRFSLGDRVADLFPDYLPPKPGPRLLSMTVEDLLTQSSGHAAGVSGASWRSIGTSWIAEFLNIPVIWEPGSEFVYSSANSFMLSAIITRTTGESVHEYIKPRLLAPLGIDDLTWDMGPENINPGGNGISAPTSALLKLAILHLDGGVWNGRRILPAAWVAEATSPRRGNPYGYHWWIGPGSSFYAYGIFGQFAFVFPEQDMILALTAAEPHGEETLRSLVWHHFPHLVARSCAAASIVQRPSPPSFGNDLLGPVGFRASRLGERISGRTFATEPNGDGIETMRLTFDAERCTFEVRDARGSHVVAAGLKAWHESDTTVSGAVLHHGYQPATMRVVAAGRWSDEATFEMVWHFVETSFRDSVTLRFGDDGLVFLRTVNVNSGPRFRPEIVAHMIDDATSAADVSQ